MKVTVMSTENGKENENGHGRSDTRTNPCPRKERGRGRELGVADETTKCSVVPL